METPVTQTSVVKDQVHEDFKTAAFIVSLLVNLTVLVTWMTVQLS